VAVQRHQKVMRLTGLETVRQHQHIALLAAVPPGGKGNVLGRSQRRRAKGK